MSPADEPLVVVIDDSEDDVLIFTRLLKSSGLSHRVLPFLSGLEAIKYFGRVANGGAERPSACFVDVNMPGYSGFEVVEAIRSSEELDGVSAIMLSSSDDRRDIVKSARAGAQCYLVKHPTADALRQVIEEAGKISRDRVAAKRVRLEFAANLLPR